MRRASFPLRCSLALVAMTLLVAGCASGEPGATSTSTGSAGGSASAAASAIPSERDEPGASGSSAPGAPSPVPSVPASTPAPQVSPSPRASHTPRPTSVASAPATAAPVTPSASSAAPASSTAPSIVPSDEPSLVPASPIASSAQCSGSAENRDFYAAAAAAMTWDVYCAVLPAGWFVESGSWELRNGGHVTVTYRGPNGAHLVLDEGTFCTAGASACSPHDHVIGPAAFGDLTGTLMDLGPNQPADGYAIYVNPGTQPPSWTATGTNLDQSMFTAIAAALLRVPAS